MLIYIDGMPQDVDREALHAFRKHLGGIVDKIAELELDQQTIIFFPTDLLPQTSERLIVRIEGVDRIHHGNPRSKKLLDQVIRIVCFQVMSFADRQFNKSDVTRIEHVEGYLYTLNRDKIGFAEIKYDELMDYNV